jgi:hypothetical protein
VLLSLLHADPTELGDLKPVNIACFFEDIAKDTGLANRTITDEAAAIFTAVL